MEKPQVIILCTGNSCRSHMAEGVLRSTAGDLFDVHSAGSDPAGFVHPLAVDVMAEIGIDISGQVSEHLDRYLDRNVETVITVCGDTDRVCPDFPGQRFRYHWAFRDPAAVEGSEETVKSAFRQIRDEIKRVFEAYAEGIRQGRGATA